ncbi:MAG: hypothetical protein ACRD2S_02135 [Terriglobales bacterium]
MKYVVLILTLLGSSYGTFVPGMYPCPFDKEPAYRHDACKYEQNTIICTYTHTHHGSKGNTVHKFSVQFPYGTPPPDSVSE